MSSIRPAIENAMVLCAGFGTRLKPLTDSCPKPLVQLGGRAILDWLLNQLSEVKVKKVVINTHHLPQLIADHIAACRQAFPFEFVLLHEPTLLGTGGGVLNALPHLGPNPFYVANCDMVWESPQNPFASLWSAYKQDAKALLGLCLGENIDGYAGEGDYRLTPKGLPQRKRSPHEICPYVFTGLRILSPQLFTLAHPNTKNFCLLPLFDAAQREGSLEAHVFQKTHFWDTGTLATLERASKHFGSSALKQPHPLSQ